MTVAVTPEAQSPGGGAFYLVVLGLDEDEDDGEDDRDGGRHGTGGQRTLPFDRMVAVFLAVEEIVENVDCARYGAEGDKGEQAAGECLGIMHLLGKDQR